MTELTEEDVLLGFLESFLADRDRDGVRSVDEYAEAWPGFEAVVSEHYRLLCQPPTASSPTRHDDVDALQSFVRGWRVDQDSCRALPIAHYLREYPNDACEVARAWLSLKQEPATVMPEATADRPMHIGIRGAFGHYQLLKQIGSGGQGQVYAAVDTHLNRKVALKLLSAPLAGSDSARRRFMREAEVASKLQHPGICAVYDLGELQGIPYIAMQLVDGVPLVDIIAIAEGSAGNLAESVAVDEVMGVECPVDLGRAKADDEGRDPRGGLNELLQFLEDTSRALHVAHEAGLIHRDIKPGNVMVAPERRPVILDFGLARDVQSTEPALTRTGDFMGTPSYMSPEQLMARPDQLDRRTDVYALGVTLYECLTLRRPFEAATLDALFVRIFAGDYIDVRRLNRHVSKDLAIVVATAMEKDQARRYQSALDLAEDLRRIREYKPIRARPIGPALRLRRWGQRNPVVATLVCVLAVALLGFLGSMAYANRRLEEQRQRAVEEEQRATRFSDPYLMEDFRDRAEELSRAFPDKIGAMEAWLEEVGPLVSRIREHRKFLSTLDPATVATWDREARLKHELFVQRFPDLLHFADEADGTVAEIRLRLGRARGLALAAASDVHRAQWLAVAQRLAAERPYGFAMMPAGDLVPLGTDPASGLEEFLHSPSNDGPIPERDARGVLSLTESTGIVFVLAPGGAFTMADARTGERQTVELLPFFVGKHEVSLGQWRRLGGAVPEAKRPIDRIPSPFHPVRGVTWDAGFAVAREHGLDLPTESQWEYAARAGTTSKWWTGDDAGTLEGRVNYGQEKNEGEPLATAEINSLAANHFGLHHVLGNVWEMCRDRFVLYSTPARPGDGLRQVESASQQRVIRGAGCTTRVGLVHLDVRTFVDQSRQIPDEAGFRLARLVTRD